MELRPDAQEVLDGYGSYLTWPFAGDIRLRELQPPALEEPALRGTDPQDCHACRSPDDDFVWVDEDWRLRTMGEDPFPASLMLFPRAHVRDLPDLPPSALASFGPVLARVEKAVLGIGAPGSPTEGLDRVARLHISRWGDGGYHLHLWLMPRPFGALQLRGTFMAVWMDFLTAADPADVARARRQIGAELAAHSGSTP